MEGPSAKGSAVRGSSAECLVAAGKTVLPPWGGHHRYHFVLDEGDGRLTRCSASRACIAGVQCTFAPAVRTVAVQWTTPTLARWTHSTYIAHLSAARTAYRSPIYL